MVTAVPGSAVSGSADSGQTDKEWRPEMGLEVAHPLADRGLGEAQLGGGGGEIALPRRRLEDTQPLKRRKSGGSSCIRHNENHV